MIDIHTNSVYDARRVAQSLVNACIDFHYDGSMGFQVPETLAVLRHVFRNMPDIFKLLPHEADQ